MPTSRAGSDDRVDRAPGHEQVLPNNVTRVCTTQKRARLAELIRVAESVCRHGGHLRLRIRLVVLIRFSRKLAQAVRLTSRRERPGQQIVDRDVVFRYL